MRRIDLWTLPLAAWVLAGSAGVAAAGVSNLAVPEPTSLALLAAGLGGAAIIKLRRRK